MGNSNHKSSQIHNSDKTHNESLSSLSAINSIKLNSISPFQYNINTRYYNESNEFLKHLKSNNNCSCFGASKNHSFNEFSYNKENLKEEENNNSKETEKISINKKPFSIIDSDSINEENKETDIKYEINDELYHNENFNLDLESKKDSLKNNKIIESYLNNNIKIENLSRKILEKTWLNNLDKEKSSYLEKVITKKEKSIVSDKLGINTENLLKGKNHNISFQSSSSSSSSSSSLILPNLKTSVVESFQIKSSYENINQITNQKYIKNKQLQNKTKEFLIKEINCGSAIYRMYGSRISTDNIFNKSAFLENLKNNSKLF